MKDLPSLRHGLRTPLNHIIGYSEMLLEDASAAHLAEIRNELKGIHGSAHQLLQLIQIRLSGTKDVSHEEFEHLRFEGARILARIRDHISSLTDGLGYQGSDLPRILGATAILSDILETFGPITLSRPLEGEGAPSDATARLLIVDDDENNRDMLQRQLERMGYAVEAASGGKQALALLSQSEFDMLLLDIVMPGMSGFEVLQSLKADLKLKGIAVIVISALDEMENVSRCIEMGADDFVAKPFDRVILQSRISAVIQRRTAEREKAQLTDRLHQLLESTGEGIFGIDLRGACTFINAAALKMLGQTREALIGHSFHDAVHGKYANGTEYPVDACPMSRAATLGQASRVVDEVFWRQNGESFPAEYASNPIFHDGELQGAVITFSDISERKRNEEKFRETAKLESLGVLAGGVAHDFNNLLTGILGNASLLLDTSILSETDREMLEQVIQSSQRAADLTKQLLAYAGKGRYEIRNVDLTLLVQETVKLIQTMIPRTVRLDMQLDAAIPMMEADPSQIQQVIMNLVINAGEAIGEPRIGTVTIKTFAETVPERGAKSLGAKPLAPGLYVVLEVTDTGSGMSEEVQSRIFDPFYTTKFTGRGLGLAAVLGIIKSHKGSIQVSSKLGQGSRFQVHIPASTNPVKRKLEPAKPAEKPRAGLVLVVDDESVILKTTQAILKTGGYETILASGGEAAIELFKDHAEEISVVLLDMMMPGMSGAEAFRILRTIRSDVPIVVSSGYSELHVMRYFEDGQVSAFIQKPYSSSSLIDKVSAVLSEANAPGRRRIKKAD